MSGNAINRSYRLTLTAAIYTLTITSDTCVFTDECRICLQLHAAFHVAISAPCVCVCVCVCVSSALIDTKVRDFTLDICGSCGPGSSVGIVTDYGLEGPVIESWRGRDFPPVQTGNGAHPASCKMGTWSFQGVKCGRGVLLTTHPLLVPRSWNSRATSTYPLGHTGPLTGSLYLIYIYIYTHTHIHIYIS